MSADEREKMAANIGKIAVAQSAKDEQAAIFASLDLLRRTLADLNRIADALEGIESILAHSDLVKS